MQVPSDHLNQSLVLDQILLEEITGRSPQKGKMCPLHSGGRNSEGPRNDFRKPSITKGRRELPGSGLTHRADELPEWCRRARVFR